MEKSKGGQAPGQTAAEAALLACLRDDGRRKVAVLFGGCSPEYAVSLASAHAVLAHLDAARYQAVPVGITREGEWYFYGGDPEAIPADRWHTAGNCIPAVVSQGRKLHGLIVFGSGGPSGVPLDAAFPVLHGQNGEDGTVQGLLELAGIPVAGCGALSSALCMDKDMAHRVVAAAGVAVPRARVLDGRATGTEALRQAEAVGYPLFVKPVRAGSSYGVTRVETPAALPEAVRRALAFDRRAVLEQAIEGFEVGCAVLGDGELLAGAVDEIELAQGFFDYTEKYTLETAKIHVPARIPPEKAREVQEAAVRIYRALGCAGFARVDLFLQPDGALVFNEVNTIPGMTAHSRYPAMMREIGVPLQGIVRRVLEGAVEG